MNDYRYLLERGSRKIGSTLVGSFPEVLFYSNFSHHRLTADVDLIPTTGNNKRLPTTDCILHVHEFRVQDQNTSHIADAIARCSTLEEIVFPNFRTEHDFFKNRNPG